MTFSTKNLNFWAVLLYAQKNPVKSKISKIKFHKKTTQVIYSKKSILLLYTTS